MSAPLPVPPGFIAVPLGKGCELVIPERIYVAGLKLGKTLRRQAAQGHSPRRRPAKMS